MSKAVIASDGKGHGVVLHWAGKHIEAEVDDHGQEIHHLYLDGAPEGISVWEGEYVYTEIREGGDWDVDVSGDSVFRDPTPEEWTAIQQGVSPWPRETHQVVTDIATGKVFDLLTGEEINLSVQEGTP
jgi:hypothetical protein